MGVGGDAVVGVEPVEGLLQVAGGRLGVGGEDLVAGKEVRVERSVALRGYQGDSG